MTPRTNKVKWIEDRRAWLWGVDHVDLPFPMKLHALVSSEEISEMWWVNEGQAFAVDRVRYKKNIMNVYFDQTKYRSLQTLLWKYGFHTIASFNNSTDDFIVYQHKFFVKNQPELCRQIIRVDHHSGLQPSLLSLAKGAGERKQEIHSNVEVHNTTTDQSIQIDDKYDILTETLSKNPASSSTERQVPSTIDGRSLNTFTHS